MIQAAQKSSKEASIEKAAEVNSGRNQRMDKCSSKRVSNSVHLAQQTWLSERLSREKLVNSW